MAAVAVIVVIILAAAVGGYFVLTMKSSTTTQTTTSSSNTSTIITSSSSSIASTVSSSVSSSSTASSSITSSISSVTSSSVVSTSSASYAGRLIFELADPNTPLASPDANVSYGITLTGLGTLPTSVLFPSVSSNGIVLSFSPDNVSITTQTSVQVAISVGENVTAGNYNLQIQATANGASFNDTFPVTVVKYLVVADPSFNPGNLTVTQGSSVTWLRLNGPVGEHGDNGSQNVIFSNGMATSPQLALYSSWTYTFPQTGNYAYDTSYRVGENGEISVIAG
jgi:plastocyanin